MKNEEKTYPLQGFLNEDTLRKIIASGAMMLSELTPVRRTEVETTSIEAFGGVEGEESDVSFAIALPMFFNMTPSNTMDECSATVATYTMGIASFVNYHYPDYYDGVLLEYSTNFLDFCERRVQHNG